MNLIPYRRSGDGHAQLTSDQQSDQQRQASSATAFAESRRAIVRAESAAAAERIPEASCDFVFIDADHTYEAVHRDLRIWWPKIKPGGMFCGHDYGGPRDRRGIWGVSRAVNQFAEQCGLKVSVGKGTVWHLRKPQSFEDARVGESLSKVRSQGVLMLLTGPGHAVRLVTALRSLRSFWSGAVTLLTTHPLSHEVGRLCAADPRLSIEHRTWPLFPGKRNATYLTKARLPRFAPYEDCLFLDADTLVVGLLDEIWNGLRRAPVVLTQFADWTTETGTIRKRMLPWKPAHHPDGSTAEEERRWTAAAARQPAINIGVFGFRRDASFLAEWEKLAVCGRKRFICDEMALQILLPTIRAELLDCRFNCSPVHAKRRTDVRVWHFHGDKHMNRPEAKSLWYPAFRRCVDENVADIGSWGPGLDPSAFVSNGVS